MLPSASNIPAPLPDVLPALPKSWSALTWQQLMACWQCKMRYGGNADVARAAALLALLQPHPQTPPPGEGSGYQQSAWDGWAVERGDIDPVTGEQQYVLSAPLHRGRGRGWGFTPRELSQMAQQALPWFDYPYGDPGKEAVKDEKGKVIEEAVAPVRGYVNPEWRDAMALPEETIVIVGDRMLTGTEWQAMNPKERKQILHSSLITHHFKLPEVTIRNLTWQQYRTLQFIAPMLFQEGISDDDALDLQAEFIAHTLVPATVQSGGVLATDPFAPKQDYKYDSDRAEQTVAFWRERLAATVPDGSPSGTAVLYCLCFQTYQTAMHYYEQVFPLLFSGGGKSAPLHDALTGEVRTINAVMKYQGYSKPEEVYAENLPIILSTLNTMAEEAKQIEQMNARIKSKH